MVSAVRRTVWEVASMQHASIVRLPAGLLALVVVAGSAGLFATFWDDAWHTDLGRDQATIPPHLLLYASMATIGAVVAAWGLVALRRDRSPAVVWRQPPLLLAAAGGTVTLVALPIDAAWHAAFGRDAVLWSPPHLLAIFGSLALLVGFLTGARPDTPRWILTGLGALLLGSAAVPVLEFEVEAWLPVDASSANRLVAHRQLYLPAGRTQGARLPGSEVAAGIVLYALGALLLALIIRQVRGLARTPQPPSQAPR
jgi:hypothetical protein